MVKVYSSNARNLLAAMGISHRGTMEDIWSPMGRNIATGYVDMSATSRPRPVTLHALSRLCMNRTRSIAVSLSIGEVTNNAEM